MKAKTPHVFIRIRRRNDNKGKLDTITLQQKPTSYCTPIWIKTLKREITNKTKIIAIAGTDEIFTATVQEFILLLQNQASKE